MAENGFRQPHELGQVIGISHQKRLACGSLTPMARRKRVGESSIQNGRFEAPRVGCAITKDKPPTHICSIWRCQLVPQIYVVFRHGAAAFVTRRPRFGAKFFEIPSRSLERNNTMAKWAASERKEKPSAMADYYRENITLIAENCIKPSV